MASAGSQAGISIWDIPLSTANLIYGTAYIALIVGSILTAVATISLFYSSAIRDKYADASITHAKKDAAEALERAIAQDAENLKIKERTAEIEKDTALIRQQTALATRTANDAHRDIKDVRTELMPRRLTQIQIESLSKALEKLGPGSVEVQTLMNGADTVGLSSDIERAFVGGGWAVFSSQVLGPSLPFPPIGVSVIHNPLGASAKDALDQAGIKFTLEHRSSRPQSGRQEADLIITIGTRAAAP